MFFLIFYQIYFRAVEGNPYQIIGYSVGELYKKLVCNYKGFKWFNTISNR